MADISQTPGNVNLHAGVKQIHAIAGEAIESGTCVYKSDSDSKIYKAQSTSSAASKVIGITSSRGEAGELLNIVVSGELDVGAALVKSKTYFLSNSSGGKISDSQPDSTGEYPLVLGTATDTDKLKLILSWTGAPHT